MESSHHPATRQVWFVSMSRWSIRAFSPFTQFYSQVPQTQRHTDAQTNTHPHANAQLDDTEWPGCFVMRVPCRFETELYLQFLDDFLAKQPRQKFLKCLANFQLLVCRAGRLAIRYVMLCATSKQWCRWGQPGNPLKNPNMIKYRKSIWSHISAVPQFIGRTLDTGCVLHGPELLLL